ncbi:Glutathione S-transferase family protein isoform 2 [Actinidia chinensis var. chinensis]|uniref:Glutathione S-transferase family protein isoform 2 n=1 Tax=Actinidia chinensis var. chinensis TaxID=1590841 RepID=A0A2R6PZI0_ACTCC|nr:Glutathione S-transferase family protein isoform 2 [Actinidia chinensis var. chinensis]
MKRFIGLAAIGRAIEGGTVTSGSTSTTHHRFLQAALYSSSSFSSAESRWFSHHEIAKHSRRSAAHSIAGTMFFSAAASSLAEDVHAKEQTPSKKFLPNDVVLYQYEACPFCNKVKDIIDKLYQKIHPEMPVDSGSEGREERKWRGWVDNHLVHVLSPNIYRTPSEAIESFDYITTHGNFSLTDRIIAKYAGAAAMYFVSKKLKKKYNITDERAALYEAADTWVDALKGRNFLGGSTPNLADLAVFGVLKPIRHLKSGRDIVENTHIGDWYARMESMVGASSRIMA